MAEKLIINLRKKPGLKKRYLYNRFCQVCGKIFISTAKRGKVCENCNKSKNKCGLK